MKKFFKLLLLTALTVCMLSSAVPAVQAKGYDNKIEVTLTGTDIKTDSGYFFLYPNNTDSVRKIKADEYNFRYTKIFVFDKNGLLIEAGENMFANSATQSGSIQEYLSIPAGGFAFAFKGAGSDELKKCYNVVTENAMLYNSTISVIHEAKGSYTDKTFTIEYNDPKKSDTAKKYLFVGNSATYVNGTPIKFKGLALAAGFDIEVDYGTVGSSYLSEFANENHQYGKNLRSKLNQNKYDFVVLQDAGSCTYSNTKPAVQKLLPLIEANGAEALLYMRYSAASTPSGRAEGAKQHYDNYSRIAEEFSLTYAPAALAYAICTEKYPEINLYSDDNSHHSKEGSYLIACTMLMGYLGADPRENTYDAQLGDVAKKLQECAYIACTEGYDFNAPEKENTYTDKKGNTYNNIAQGMTYTASGEVYVSDKWSDADESGNIFGKLTDGEIAEDGTDGAIGCWKNAGHSITIDLESLCKVYAVKTDMFGNESWGITDPAGITLSVAVSNDGASFTEIGNMESTKTASDSTWSSYDFTLELSSPVTAKYIRITYIGGKFNWSSEISVYGTKNAQPEPDVSQTSEAAPTESGNDEESEESEVIPFEEHKNKKYEWLYWLIGALVLVAVIAIAVVITKKKK